MAEFRHRRDFTREEASRFLRYDPGTGAFYWLVERNSHGGKIRPGDPAGGRKDGYVQIKLFGRYYRAHHLAWLFVTGEWPREDCDVDHANRNRADNRWSNLRIATRSENNINGMPGKANKSGYRGVSIVKATGKWHARIEKDGRVHLLGDFEDINQAVAARRTAELAMFGAYSPHPTGSAP